MKRALLLIASCAFAYELKSGWNLVAAMQDIYPQLLKRDFIEIVWHYDNGQWRYFHPTKEIQGVKKLTQIPKGSGFWVLSSVDQNYSFTINRGDSWYWQLQGNIVLNLSAKVYDIDLFDTPKSTIEMLHKEGKIVICYFSAGTYEEWREDSNAFANEALGNKLADWAGERWLDIRRIDVRKIMKNRLDLAMQKGCDGVEPDNVDGYKNTTRFALTYQDQLAYNRFLAKEAHKRGLLIGLKNDLEQIKDLVNDFDFAVNEECFEFYECSYYEPFLRENKAVFNAEYTKQDICDQARLIGISAAFYNKTLNGSLYQPCF